MKIIVAGSRDVTEYDYVRHAMIVSGYWKAYGNSIEVVSGMARGADLLGKKFAENNGLICHEFPADWNTYGKGAGHIRNIEMGKFALKHGGKLLALWDGISPGTKHMLIWAKENGLDWYIYRVDKHTRYVKTGTMVRTDFSGKWTTHEIVERREGFVSQSGVMFRLSPPVPKSGGADAWIDADWFKLIEEK